MHQVHTWMTIALTHSMQGRAGEMTDAYARSCELQPERVTPWLCRLVGSLQLEDSETVRMCSVQLESLGAEAKQRSEHNLKGLLIRRDRGDWRLSPRHSKSVISIGTSIGGLAERYAHVLATSA